MRKAIIFAAAIAATVPAGAAHAEEYLAGVSLTPMTTVAGCELVAVGLKYAAQLPQGQIQRFYQECLGMPSKAEDNVACKLAPAVPVHSAKLSRDHTSRLDCQ